MELNVEGMSCGGCVKSVAKIISKHTELDPESIRVDLAAKKAEFDPIANFETEELIVALGKAGFRATIKTEG